MSARAASRSSNILLAMTAITALLMLVELYLIFVYARSLQRCPAQYRSPRLERQRSTHRKERS
jgi:hypothetical protein